MTNEAKRSEESGSTAGLATCTQHMGEYKNYWVCGKPAKWIDPNSGRKLCGIHRKVVDAFNARIGKPLCIEVANVLGKGLTLAAVPLDRQVRREQQRGK